MGLRQVEQDFSSFFATFLKYLFDDVSNQSMQMVLQNFEKSSNMPKIWQKMKKSLVQLALNPFLHGTSITLNPGFGYPKHNFKAQQPVLIVPTL